MHKVTILCDTYIPNPDCIGEIQIGNYYWEVEYNSSNKMEHKDLCRNCLAKFMLDYSDPNLFDIVNLSEIRRYQA